MFKLTCKDGSNIVPSIGFYSSFCWKAEKCLKSVWASLQCSAIYVLKFKPFFKLLDIKCMTIIINMPLILTSNLFIVTEFVNFKFGGPLFWDIL